MSIHGQTIERSKDLPVSLLEQTLSDGSKAYNVRIATDEGVAIVLCMRNLRTARSLMEMIEKNCVAAEEA